MKITNNCNLPSAFVNFCKQEEKFAENEIRVSSMLGSVREAVLKKRYNDDIEKDVSDQIWAIFGTAVHSIMEKNEEDKESLVEHRMKIHIMNYIVTGKCDLFKNNTLIDYKTTTVWKYVHEDYDRFKRQMLMYAVLLAENGYECIGADIVMMFRDWVKTKANELDYPSHQVEIVHFDFSEEDIERMKQEMISWIVLYDMSIKDTDNNLPNCSNKDRFRDPDTWAVMKKNQKKAVKAKFESEEAAEEWIKENGKGDYIEYRPGEDKKCLYYCDCKSVCSYAKKLCK